MAEPKDPSKKHFYISMVKSCFRIGAGASFILGGSLVTAGVLLILAELLGIAEEF